MEEPKDSGIEVSERSLKGQAGLQNPGGPHRLPSRYLRMRDFQGLG